MISIRDRINTLISQYKKDFYLQTGFPLIAIPAVGLMQIPMDELIRLVCFYLELEEKQVFTSKKGIVSTAKEYITSFARKMGYSDVEIAPHLNLDRTSIVHFRKNFDDSMQNRQYKYDFYRCLEYVYENISTPKKDDRSWHHKMEEWDNIFLETEAIQAQPMRVIKPVNPNDGLTDKIVDLIIHTPAGITSSLISKSVRKDFPLVKPHKIHGAIWKLKKKRRILYNNGFYTINNELI